MYMELPTLYTKSLNGKIMSWCVRAQDDLVITEFGTVDGKKNTHKERSLPVNIGKANEMLANEHAKAEALAAHARKIKDGYATNVEDLHGVLLMPALAHPRMKSVTCKGVKSKVARPIAFGATYVQRKYNGLRCLCINAGDGQMSGAFWGMNSGWTFRSREATSWTNLGHLQPGLDRMGGAGDIFDGEVYAHGTPLQTLNSYVKRMQPGTKTLQLVVYDMPGVAGDLTGTWEDRHAALRSRYQAYLSAELASAGFPALPEAGFAAIISGELAEPSALLHFVWSLPVQLAPTWPVVSEEDLKDHMTRSLLGGYEGLIVRTGGRPYAFDKRTDALIKIKNFIDAEFTVLGGKPRTLVGAGPGGLDVVVLDTFVCQVSEGKTFEVVPIGDMLTVRRLYWENLLEHIGQKLTVRYLELSVDGIPQGNPVGRGFRLEADLPAQDEDDDEESH